MKRIILVCLATLALVAASDSAYPFSISLGTNLWHNWWDPAWHDGKFRMTQVTPTNIYLSSFDMPRFSAGSALLFGPVLSVSLNSRWSVASTFMYGRFNYSTFGAMSSWDRSNPSKPMQSVSADMSRNVERWDSDTAVTFAVNRVFSVFLGFKAQGYDYNEVLVIENDSKWMRLESAVAHYGAGLGVGATVPLRWGFFLLGNVSGVVMRGIEDTEMKFTSMSGLDCYFKTGYFISYGFTASASIAYVISSAGVTLAAGFRYQMLWYRQAEREISHLELDGTHDRYYGVTFSAIYRLTFGGDED